MIDVSTRLNYSKNSKFDDEAHKQGNPAWL